MKLYDYGIWYRTWFHDLGWNLYCIYTIEIPSDQQIKQMRKNNGFYIARTERLINGVPQGPLSGVKTFRFDGVTFCDPNYESDDIRLAHFTNLHNRMSKLPIEKKAALTLGYFQGISKEELARLEGTAAGMRYGSTDYIKETINALDSVQPCGIAWDTRGLIIDK